MRASTKASGAAWGLGSWAAGGLEGGRGGWRSGGGGRGGGGVGRGGKQGGGVGKLGRMVFGGMGGWMEERVRGHAAESAAAGDEKGAMSWNAALANIVYEQGRHDEAVVIYEAVLKYRRRVLPENHPDIGVM